MKVSLTIVYILALIYHSCIALDDNRDSWQQPEKIMDTVGIREGMVIGEVGAGEGYFTFKLAKRVGSNGFVYANDIKARVLKIIERRCEEEGYNNIKTVLGEVDDPKFPKNELDMVIMVIAFHDFAKPVELMQNLKASLKPTATVVIVERDPDKWEHGRHHFMTKDEILKTVENANYELLRIETFLPRDNIFIYKPK